MSDAERPATPAPDAPATVRELVRASGRPLDAPATLADLVYVLEATGLTELRGLYPVARPTPPRAELLELVEVRSALAELRSELAAVSALLDDTRAAGPAKRKRR